MVAVLVGVVLSIAIHVGAVAGIDVEAGVSAWFFVLPASKVPPTPVLPQQCGPRPTRL